MTVGTCTSKGESKGRSGPPLIATPASHGNASLWQTEIKVLFSQVITIHDLPSSSVFMSDWQLNCVYK